MDSDLRTTHVRCGSDLREALIEAGFEGHFLEFSDPVCQGPVPADADLGHVRASFLASSYGVPLNQAKQRLADELQALEDTIQEPRVVLWFEHDTYDQLVLARILAFYRERGVPGTLELICIDAFPGVDRFIGLGQLTPRDLRSLWPDREPVGSSLLRFGARVWKALRDPSPWDLHKRSGDSDALPLMGRALERHLRELPWSTDGLSLTERLTLKMLAEGRATEADLFRRLTFEVEPLPYLGDTMYSAVIRGLASAENPPLVAAIVGGATDGSLELTETGFRILDGDLTWLQCGPAERWVGGVRILPGRTVWCWNPTLGHPVQQEPNVDRYP